MIANKIDSLEFLGLAVSDWIGDMAESRPDPESMYAKPTRRVRGLVAMLMESDTPPYTLTQLSISIGVRSDSIDEIHVRERVLNELAEKGVLEMGEGAFISYNPPQTQHYDDVLTMAGLGANPDPDRVN